MLRVLDLWLESTDLRWVLKSSGQHGTMSSASRKAEIDSSIAKKCELSVLRVQNASWRKVTEGLRSAITEWLVE